MRNTTKNSIFKGALLTLRSSILKVALLALRGAILLSLFPGCATRLHTPSGGPEITVHSDLETVKNAFSNELAARGFAIRRHEGSIVEATKNGDIGDNIFFGTPAHPATEKLIRLNFLPAGDSIRVLYHGYNVSHSLGEFELQGDWPWMQWRMECIAADLENRPHPPAPPRAPGPRVSAK